MAKQPTLKLDHAAIGRIAKGAEAQAVVTAAANKVAAAVDTDGEVEVVEYRTDRAVAAVKVSAYEQAANGALSRGAASAGISITT